MAPTYVRTRARVHLSTAAPHEAAGGPRATRHTAPFVRTESTVRALSFDTNKIEQERASAPVTQYTSNPLISTIRALRLQGDVPPQAARHAPPQEERLNLLVHVATQCTMAAVVARGPLEEQMVFFVQDVREPQLL